MKFWEAMKALEEGKKIRCKTWKKGAYECIETSKLPRCISTLELHTEYEWELYEEPEKTYTFQEVIKGLKEGRKYRRPHHKQSLILQPTSFVDFDTGSHEWLPTIMDLEANDWIEQK